MDNHPIPQDITGFQFKLIGKMTIKQFVYLAVGAVIAWVIFFFLKPPALIKWPLSFISLGLGAMIAFVPIDGRPMDVMLRNFIKALLSPTQFVYQKTGGKLPDQASLTPVAKTPPTKPAELSSAFLQPYAATTDTSKTSDSTAHHHHSLFGGFKDSFERKQEDKEKKRLDDIKKESKKLEEEIKDIKETIEKSKDSAAPVAEQSSQPPVYSDPSQATSITIEQVDSSDEIKKKENEIEKVNKEKDKLKEEMDTLKKQLEETLKAKEEADTAPEPPPSPPPAPLSQASGPQADLEKQLIESNRQKEALEKEIVAMRSKSQGTQQAFSPTVAKPLETTQRVRSVPFGMEKSVGIPSIPDAPNLITGIVKDPRGNPLQNILIEVKDQDANPVRAFKTNGLGKFASATSLSNGKYVISFEDSGETHKFDAVELELVGSPVMPLEIISVDPREELRRELFN